MYTQYEIGSGFGRVRKIGLLLDSIPYSTACRDVHTVCTVDIVRAVNAHSSWRLGYLNAARGGLRIGHDAWARAGWSRMEEKRGSGLESGIWILN